MHGEQRPAIDPTACDSIPEGRANLVAPSLPVLEFALAEWGGFFCGASTGLSGNA